MIEEALVLLIQIDPAVAALTPEGGGYLSELPKNQVLPSWTYMFAGGAVEHTLQAERGPRMRRLQIDCYSGPISGAGALQLADAIDAVLDGFSGFIFDSQPAPYFVHSCLMEQEPMDLFDPGTRTYRRMIEYDLFFE